MCERGLEDAQSVGTLWTLYSILLKTQNCSRNKVYVIKILSHHATYWNLKGVVWFCPSLPSPGSYCTKSHLVEDLGSSSILPSQDLLHYGARGWGVEGVGLDVSFGWTYRLWGIIASGLLPDSNQSCPDFCQVGGTSVSAYSMVDLNTILFHFG